MHFLLKHPCRWLLIVATCFSTLFAFPVSAEELGINYDNSVDVRIGRRYFERQCARCHGFDARGSDETGAPDLTASLRYAVSEQAMFDVIRDGIDGTSMLPVPAEVPDATVWQLVAYMGSLRIDPNSVTLAGDRAVGEQLFYGKGDCDSCHMVYGRGGRSGPDLSFVGEGKAPTDLLAALIDPDAEVAPRWWRLQITDADGVQREGFRMSEDSFTIRLIDNDTNLWFIPRDQIQSYARNETSSMPAYADLLDDQELDDLVAYLFWLRREEPGQ